MIKRAFDLICAATGLLLLFPLLVFVGTWIKRDSQGPVFFRQERVGLHGTVFRIHKFRTMVVGASRAGAHVTVRSDSRITAVGRFLRKYKLDELPQLIDVILGRMSLVGPRPEVPRYVDMTDPRWVEVLGVRPGITGPTQLRYRNEEDIIPEGCDVEAYYRAELLPRKLQSDLEYVRTRTMWGDISTVLRTLSGYR